MDHPLPAHMNSIDLDYRPIHKQAEELQASFHARMQDPFHPSATAMKQQADSLVADLAANKHPKDIEERLTTLQSHLLRARDSHDTPIFSDENLDYFHRKYDQIRSTIQAHPNYNKPRENYFNQPNRGMNNNVFKHH